MLDIEEEYNEVRAIYCKKFGFEITTILETMNFDYAGCTALMKQCIQNGKPCKDDVIWNKRLEQASEAYREKFGEYMSTYCLPISAPVSINRIKFMEQCVKDGKPFHSPARPLGTMY